MMPSCRAPLVNGPFGIFWRAQKALAHFGGGGRNCLTGSYFTAKMPLVAMRIMLPESPP